MKRPKQADTAEFKELAVKRIKNKQSVSTVCQELGLSDQTLRYWVKAAVEGRLSGAGGRVVISEERALSRLRAEHLRRKRELEIIKKRRRTSRRMLCEVRLDCRTDRVVFPWPKGVPCLRSASAAIAPGNVAARRIASD